LKNEFILQNCSTQKNAFFIMKKINRFLTLFISLIATIALAQESEKQIGDLYGSVATMDEGKLTYVLMHNRKGIRIEYCVDKKRLELWLSPLAGKSIDYKDRNFSNRDDHSRLFDKITFPDLEPRDFMECKYDPFHSILYFKNAKLHVLSVYDKPAVMLWFEGNGGRVDIKTDKQDFVPTYTDQLLLSNHPDRGKDFQYVAQIGKGTGKFKHMRDLDVGRSFFSRAELSKNQPLIIAGELASEQPAMAANALAQIENLGNIITDNDDKIEAALNYGKIKVKDNLDLQKIVDINRRVLLSTQDESGAQRAAIKYIYYLIWHRDGGMTAAYNGYTGNVTPLDKWTEFALNNPTVYYDGKTINRFYGQLVNGKISKWEEDGLFFALWPAFTHWTQTGKTKYLSKEYAKLIADALAWMENNFYDKNKGLFFRYHYGEAPFSKSRGDGYDDAVGSINELNYSIQGKDTIVKAYDVYINSLMYSVYMMQMAMTPEQSPNRMMTYMRIMDLKSKMKAFYKKPNELPIYGELITSVNKSIPSPAFGMDECDYVWGLTLPPFVPFPEAMPNVLDKILDDYLQKPKGHFVASWFSTLAAMDPAIHDEKKMFKAMDYMIPQAVRAGRYLPMAYTIPEIVDVEDGNLYHDVRPQGFSAGAWLGALGNFAVRRMPFGIAIRGTKYIEQITNYEYKNTLLNIKYEGEGNIQKISVNGLELNNCLQITDQLLDKKVTDIKVSMSKDAPELENTLISSTMRLYFTEQKGNAKNYAFEGYGQNIAVFKNLTKKIVATAVNGAPLSPRITKNGSLTYVEFDSYGKFLITIE
jgi:hypothetical protein